jgi:hypothetical protein
MESIIQNMPKNNFKNPHSTMITFNSNIHIHRKEKL